VKETSLTTPSVDEGPKLNKMLATLLLAISGALVYLASFVQPGWFTYALSVLPLAVISFTALARANDICATLTGWNWQMRRIGLVLTGVATALMILMPLGKTHDFPTWTQVMIDWGVAMTWFTTPGMPPWWNFMLGRGWVRTP
jgi:hypothetical protein